MGILDSFFGKQENLKKKTPFEYYSEYIALYYVQKNKGKSTIEERKKLIDKMGDHFMQYLILDNDLERKKGEYSEEELKIYAINKTKWIETINIILHHNQRDEDDKIFRGPTEKMLEAAKKRYLELQQKKLNSKKMSQDDYSALVRDWSLKDQQTKILAVEKIDSTEKLDFLKDELEENSPEATDVIEAIKRRVAKLNKKEKPDQIIYLNKKLSFECKNCGQKSPINSLTLKPSCKYCNESSEINEESDFSSHYFNYYYEPETYPIFTEGEKFSYEKPSCWNCQTSLDNYSEIKKSEEIQCKKCNSSTFAYKPPKWLKNALILDKRNYSKYKPTMIFSSEPIDGEVKHISHGDKQIKPVVFACQECSAKLKIDSETPRILTCDYCKTDQYLPDDLWKAFHTVPVMENIYVKLELIK